MRPHYDNEKILVCKKNIDVIYSNQMTFQNITENSFKHFYDDKYKNLRLFGMHGKN